MINKVNSEKKCVDKCPENSQLNLSSNTCKEKTIEGTNAKIMELDSNKPIQSEKIVGIIKDFKSLRKNENNPKARYKMPPILRKKMQSVALNQVNLALKGLVSPNPSLLDALDFGFSIEL